MLAPNECPSARTDLDLRQAQSSLLRRAFVRYDPPDPPIYTVDPGVAADGRGRVAVDRGSVQPFTRPGVCVGTVWRQLLSSMSAAEAVSLDCCGFPAGRADRWWPPGMLGPAVAESVARSPVFVVHACWLPGGSGLEPGRLGMWGEDSSAPATLPRKPGRRPRVRPHPFAAAHGDLIAALPAAGAKATTSTVTLALPTWGGGPIA